MIPATVLVVEDERVVALHLKQQLTRLGYQVPAMATAGPQALQQMAQHRPDIVLMDIHIEGDLDGIETAARIPKELHIPVIYLSAFSEEKTLERARDTRPYAYLLKPFSERELHAAIQMVLERHRADAVSSDHTQRLEQLVSARTESLLTANKALARETEDRLNAERALLQSQKMEAIGQLTGGIAHDFNNLMQVVIGNLDVLTRVLPESPVLHRQLAEKALGGARRAAQLTQRLLAYARQQPLAPRPLNINELIADMTDLMRRALGETIDIETMLGEELWLVESDQNQLESAILNLVLNSRDAMPDGGKLTIETQNLDLGPETVRQAMPLVAGAYVMICVSDTGHGMDPDTLNRAFEPFFTTKDVGAGTGLGLSQVYGFVKQSNGHVKVYSEVGEGTTLKIYLPRLLGTAIPVPAPEAAKPEPRAGGTETILVVEDDAEVRLFTVGALREMGYQIVEAANAHAAMQVLGTPNCDIHLLFTDVVLPGGVNGAELAVKAKACCPNVKVLFTSGYARNALVHHGRLDPGVELISKPFTTAELRARIRDALDRPGLM